MSDTAVDKWMHLSDLHFGTETRAACDALRHLIEAHNPRGLVISGDVTQRARPREFDAARRFLEEVSQGRKLLVVPGNHDLPLFRVWERLLAPYRLFCDAFDDVAPVHVEDTGHFRFILVNTTRPRRHKQGSLDDDQIERVAWHLASAPDGAIRAVVLHHPLPSLDDSGRPFPGAYVSPPRAARAVEEWARSGLELVLCGHTHHPRIYRLTPPLPPRGLDDGEPGLRPKAAKKTSSNQLEQAAPRITPWLIQAGTSLSRRLRSEPNSLFILSTPTADPAQTPLSRRPVMLERWDLSLSSERFERTSHILLN